MKTIEEMMAEDADLLGMPTKEELGDLEVLANKQLAIEKKIKEVEAYMKDLVKSLNEISNVAIPAIFDQLHLEKLTLDNGMNVAIKEDIRASIRADFKKQAVQWLDENKLGGIVKHEMVIKLGRGEKETVDKLSEFCDSLDVDYDDIESVHAGTLKATVKEQRQKGVEFPEEYFSIFPDRKTVIKK